MPTFRSGVIGQPAAIGISVPDSFEASAKRRCVSAIHERIFSDLPSARLLANRAAAARHGKNSACVKRLTLSLRLMWQCNCATHHDPKGDGDAQAHHFDSNGRHRCDRHCLVNRHGGPAEICRATWRIPQPRSRPTSSWSCKARRSQSNSGMRFETISRKGRPTPKHVRLCSSRSLNRASATAVCTGTEAMIIARSGGSSICLSKSR
jgi:hypothetical protein